MHYWVLAVVNIQEDTMMFLDTGCPPRCDQRAINPTNSVVHRRDCPERPHTWWQGEIAKRKKSKEEKSEKAKKNYTGPDQ